ncbi:hypothetical protein [Cedecea sp. P7760]|uniref:hypothetical protein n=1 Tax=Cedecea sp. P7760 TaxID=2726983 RepID=UPI0015A12FEF|nr:hypothetical protein [Cedecea sp. P7760]NWC62606.1 hypothetical protein [Cedecea sp. P7760]
MGLSQFGKDFDVKLKNQKRIKDFIHYFEVVGKVIPVLIFFSTIYGSFQLFNFSNQYHISFLDLAKSNVIFTYGILFFILTSVIIFLPFSVLIWNFSFGNAVYKTFIRRSRVGFLRKYKDFALIILCFFVSLWPLIFIIENTMLWTVLFLMMPLFFGLYVIFFTGKSNFNFRHLSFYNGLIEKLTIVFFLCIPVFLGMLCFLLFIQIFKRYLSDAPAALVLFITSLIVFSLSYLAIKSSITKKTTAVAKEVLFGIIIFVFFVLSIPLNDFISDKVAKTAGLGFEARCYQANEIKKASIPGEYVKNTSNEKIAKIFVVANIDDIYYLSINDQPEPKATLRFKNSNLMQISCPK